MADIVVVGAGSAGATTAALLARDGTRQILLLEAGPDYRSADTPAALTGPNVTRALGLRSFHWHGLKARLTSVQKPRSYVSGRGVGGSSAINGQLAIRPAPADFDRWAWSFDEVLPAFMRLEDDHDFGDRPYHGSDGPLPVVRLPPSEWGAVSLALWEAAEVARHDDVNAPDSTGLSPAAWNRRNGRRVSTNDAYLEPVRERSNLSVQPDALVSRVVIRGDRAVGVQVGPRFIEAGEVVLCAGAIYSPAILMRSGIGPADELRALGIEVVADLPEVGRNLADHPAVWFHFPLRTPGSLDGLNGHCVLRLDDVQILPLDRTLTPASGGLMVSLMRPHSTGRVRLRTPDPSIDPEVVFGMLADPRDLAGLRVAVRLARDIARRPSFSRITDRHPDPDVTDEWLLRSCDAHSHATGTCRMGTVVDAYGRVTGVEGLRVADASIMPAPVSAPTHLTTVMIAERLCEGR